MMKKLILLLLLPLTTLMAVDYTMTKEGLFANTAAQSPTPGDSPAPSTDSGKTNPYLEPVNLPECDANNPEVQFIRSNADWSKINSSSKRIFCVSPGDYRSLRNIKLTVSGTAKKRRYIILNNGNDTHPGKLDKNQLANFALDLEGASYWTIDRASAFDVTSSHVFVIGKNSTHNIINRLYTTNTTSPTWLRDGANYNTFQNCFFDGLSNTGYDLDTSAIYLEDWNAVTNIHGTKIINNEFKNIKGIKLASKEDRVAYYDDTIINRNINSYTDKIRCNCYPPISLDPNGECMITEGSLVSFKGGSSNENNPIIVSNNIMYGARKSRVEGSIGSNGDGILAYMGSAYLHIYGNVIFDSQNGITLADSYDRPYGTYKAQIHDNIIVDSGETRGDNNYASLRISQAKDANIHNNLIKDPRGSYWAKCHYNFEDNFFGNNTVINPAGKTLLSTPNKYPIEGLPTDKIYNTADEAGYTEDFTFTTDNFTNSPRVITLKNVVKAN